jgi:hypothetical protein
MTRRTWSAVLALSLAGGVYLTAMPAQASNMGFKLERDFNFKRTSAAGGAPLQNIYYVSIPYFNGLGDVADSTVPNASKCIGDPNGPPGPAGDGHINSDDVICDWWTARANPPTAGAFQLLSIDSANCGFFSRTGAIQFGAPAFAGTAFPPAGTDLWTNRGYQVNLTTGATGDPQNRAIIVGSHDPSFTGQVIHFSTTCGTAAPRADLLNVPYHTMYQKTVELLCGLRGVDWDDADNNWRPDDPSPAGCAGGIFDGARPITVLGAFNDDPALGGFSQFRGQTAAIQFGNVVLNPADPFDLIPGEAYRVSISAGHVDTTFLSPHF